MLSSDFSSNKYLFDAKDEWDSENQIQATRRIDTHRKTEI